MVLEEHGGEAGGAQNMDLQPRREDYHSELSKVPNLS